MALAVNEAFTSAEDQNYLIPIRFAYDYIGGKAHYLKPPSLKLNCHMQSQKYLQRDHQEMKHQSPDSDLLRANAIEILPCAAGMILPTGLQFFWQSKHWKVAHDMTKELLEEFVRDKAAQQTFKPNGVSFASTAKTEIQNIGEGWSMFPFYLYPLADKQRAKLLAVATACNFLFDESWETHDKLAVENIKDAFISMISSKNDRPDPSKSSLQSLLDSTIQEFREQDRVAGNGGQEVIDGLVDFLSHSKPPEHFQTLDQFLEFRWDDIAMPLNLASVKFSIKSSVDIHSPKLERFNRLFGNHLSITNDLASWRKEKIAFDSGEVSCLINAVDVVGKLMGLPEDAAISMTYALQLDMECQIDAEVEQFRAAGNLDEAEWQFVDAVLLVLSGNVLFSTITNRYGGEASRL